MENLLAAVGDMGTVCFGEIEMKELDFDAQDMKGRIITLEQWQNGVNGKLGAAAKLEILWRSHVWLYCTLSACIGSVLTFYIQKLVTK